MPSVAALGCDVLSWPQPSTRARETDSRDCRVGLGYRSEPDPTRQGVVEGWFRGRVLGGSSSINGTMYVRGAAADFERWGEGWSARNVMETFRDMESSDQPGALRGDRDLRVHGMNNLWIADASIIPTPISGNTNAACMMIGWRLGRGLAEQDREKLDGTSLIGGCNAQCAVRCKCTISACRTTSLMKASPACLWTINHTLAVSDPRELFPERIQYVGE